MKHIVYISDNSKPERFLTACLRRLYANAINTGCELITVTEKPVEYGHRRLLLSHFPKPPGCEKLLGIFIAYLVGLSFCSDAEICFLADDDCLYPDEHFRQGGSFVRACFNIEITYLSRKGFFEMYNRQVLNNAGLFGTAALLRQYMAWKLDEFAAGEFTSYEPAQGGPRPYRSTDTRTTSPLIDIRIHNHTWSPPPGSTFRDADAYWGSADSLLGKLGERKET